MDSNEVFIYYDGPLFYTAVGPKGQLLLVYWYDIFREEGFDTYLVMPISKDVIAQLKACTLSMYDTVC